MPGVCILKQKGWVFYWSKNYKYRRQMKQSQIQRRTNLQTSTKESPERRSFKYKGETLPYPYIYQLEKLKAHNRELQSNNVSLLQKIEHFELDNIRIRDGFSKDCQSYQLIIKRLEIQKNEHIMHRNLQFQAQIKELLESHQLILKQFLKSKQSLINQLQQKDRISQMQLSQLFKIKHEKNSLHEELNRLKEYHQKLFRENQALHKELENQRQYMESQINHLQVQRSSDHKEFTHQLENIRAQHRKDYLQLENNYQKQLRNKEEENLSLHDKIASLKRALEDEKRLSEEEFNLVTRTMKDQLEKVRLQLANRNNQIQNIDLEYKKLLQSNSKQMNHNRQLERQLFQLVEINKDINQRADQFQSEIQKMKVVLIESSGELQRCKNEIVIADENIRRLIEQGDRQRNKLLMIIQEKNKQALTWRQSYFTLKSSL